MKAFAPFLTGWDIFSLFLKTLKRLPCLRSWRWSQINQAIVQTGIGSLSMITISTSFAGIIVTHEIAWHMNAALHTVSMIPGFTAQFILRELGIAIPALLLVAKVGASTAAEVGTMKITEQIDALKLLGIDPIEYLVFPKFIGAIISSACLTLIAISVTLFCAMAVAIYQYHFNSLEYINALRHFISLKDLGCGVLKGAVCGSTVPIVSCAYGLRCLGGAEGVGNATTQAVVTATMAVILLDFVLTYVFTLIF